MNKSRILKSVEQKVCDSVETAFAIEGHNGSVDRQHIYDGQRTEQNIAARFFIFRTLHDIYGFSHADISRLSGISRRNVMRAVAKIRSLMFADHLYSAIKQEIDNHITQGINLL